MNKRFLVLAIACALGLTACGGPTSHTLKSATEAIQAESLPCEDLQVGSDDRTAIKCDVAGESFAIYVKGSNWDQIKDSNTYDDKLAADSWSYTCTKVNGSYDFTDKELAVGPNWYAQTFTPLVTLDEISDSLGGGKVMKISEFCDAYFAE
jgi:hypothetical protein